MILDNNIEYYLKQFSITTIMVDTKTRWTCWFNKANLRTIESCGEELYGFRKDSLISLQCDGVESAADLIVAEQWLDD